MTEETPKEPIKGHCPTCGGARFASVIAFYREFESDDYTWSNQDHRILRCGGCGTVYYQKVATFSEDFEHVDTGTGEYDREYHEVVSYFPAPSKRPRPNWVKPWELNGDLYDLLDQTYNALNIDARTLAGIGIRTVFDKASELVGIDPAVTFDEKLNALLERGKIGSDERQHLQLLTDAGSAAAHRGWKPALDELHALMDIMEAFVYRTFVLTREFNKIKQRIPQKQKRLPSPE